MIRNNFIVLCNSNKRTSVRFIHDVYRESPQLLYYIRKNTKRNIIHDKITSYPDEIENKNMYGQWETFYKLCLFREIAIKNNVKIKNDCIKSVLPLSLLFPEKYRTLNINDIVFQETENIENYIELNELFESKIEILLRNEIKNTDDKTIKNYVCKLITLQIYNKDRTFIKDNYTHNHIINLYNIMCKCVQKNVDEENLFIMAINDKKKLYIENYESIKFIESFLCYMDKEINTRTILKDIYNMSICENIGNGKISCDQDYKNLISINLENCLNKFPIENITKYSEHVKNSNVVELFETDILSDKNLCSINDISTKRGIINVNFAVEESYIYHRLYMLLYSAGIRKFRNKKCDKISFYSILLGKEYFIDISKLKIKFLDSTNYEKFTFLEEQEVLFSLKKNKISKVQAFNPLSSQLNEIEESMDLSRQFDALLLNDKDFEKNKLDESHKIEENDEMEDVDNLTENINKMSIDFKKIEETYITCECGSMIKNNSSSIKQHSKTKKHNLFYQ